MWNKNTMRMVKYVAKLAQDYYPEVLGKLYVVNAPVLVSGIWSVIKGWIDEKTRSKINILGSNFHKQIFEFCDHDQIPTFLGGTLENELDDEIGPWSEFEVVDSQEEGAVVGVRRKNCPDKRIFTPDYVLQFENPSVRGIGISGTKGAVIKTQDGKYIPNNSRTKSQDI